MSLVHWFILRRGRGQGLRLRGEQTAENVDISIQLPGHLLKSGISPLSPPLFSHIVDGTGLLAADNHDIWQRQATSQDQNHTMHYF